MALPDPAAGDTPLSHGYTLASIRELTLIAVRCELFYRARDYHERAGIAWSAIAEHLYASEQTPSRPWGHDWRRRTTHPARHSRIMRSAAGPPAATPCADQSRSFAQEEQRAIFSSGLPQAETAHALKD